MNPRQELFCREYVIDFNGAAAARRAGYAAASAAVTASQLLTNPNLSGFIMELSCGLHKKLNLTAEQVLERINKIATVDRRKLYDENGHLKKVVDLDDETALALEGVKYTKDGIELKMISQSWALDHLAKIHNLHAEHEKNSAPNVTINIAGKDSSL